MVGRKSDHGCGREESVGFWGLSHPRPPKNTLTDKVDRTGARLTEQAFGCTGCGCSQTWCQERCSGSGQRPIAPVHPVTGVTAGRCQGQEHKKYFCKGGITILFFPGRMEVFFRLPGAFTGTIGWRRGRPGPGRTKSLCGGLLRAGFVPGQRRGRLPGGAEAAGAFPGLPGPSASPEAAGGDVTMGATQGSAGSGPREPAPGAEQVGNIPALLLPHRGPPGEGAGRGAVTPRTGVFVTRGTRLRLQRRSRGCRGEEPLGAGLLRSPPRAGGDGAGAPGGGNTVFFPVKWKRRGSLTSEALTGPCGAPGRHVVLYFKYWLGSVCRSGF